MFCSNLAGGGGEVENDTELLYNTIVVPYHAGGIVRVTRYTACKIAWHIWEQPVVSVRSVVPVAAVERVVMTSHLRVSVQIEVVERAADVLFADKNIPLKGQRYTKSGVGKKRGEGGVATKTAEKETRREGGGGGGVLADGVSKQDHVAATVCREILHKSHDEFKHTP